MIDTTLLSVIRSQYLPNHNQAVPSLRLLIATTIASSFSSIQTARLQKWLDFASASEVAQFVENLNGWTVQGDSVKIEGNGDNDVKAGVVKEQVELSRKWSDRCRKTICAACTDRFPSRPVYRAYQVDLCRRSVRSGSEGRFRDEGFRGGITIYASSTCITWTIYINRSELYGTWLSMALST